MVVNMDKPQNGDQVLNASEVENVHHEERDYLVKAWIVCQYTGLYPHGDGLRHYLQVITVLHSGLRGGNVSLN